MEWSEKDSLHVDDWAASSYRTPLQPDPHLYQLLANDRAEAPRQSSRLLRPHSCTDCFIPLRHSSEPADGRSEIHTGRGLCNNCYNLRRTHGTLPSALKVVNCPDTCVGCTKPMQPRDLDNPVPHKVVHQAAGLCNSCYSKQRRRIRDERRRSDARQRDSNVCAAN